MKFEKPIIETITEGIFHLAPIPFYQKIYNDEISNDAYNLGLKVLDDVQKQMGQELPEQYDYERQHEYEINYDRKEEWVENHEYQPIGSRFWTPPNDFLNREEDCVQIIKDRIFDGFLSLLSAMNVEVGKRVPKIRESWLQYYEPYSGRGHQAHNHCRWDISEATDFEFSGGYYLDDGEPILDHPYSGVFAFHIRGMKYHIRPKKGMLNIWPYDIVHSVGPFYGKRERALINFNITLVDE
jgi:hypothetical protein